MKSPRCDKRARPMTAGFTLVELLVVITIIGILIALLLPAVQAAREAARRMQCGNNFKQVGLALHNYHAAKACFPPGMFDPTSKPNVPVYWSWSTYILPYIEQQALYDQFDFTNGNHFFSTAANQLANATILSAYVCASDPASGELVASSSTSWLTPGHSQNEQSAPSNMCGVSDSINECSSGSYFKASSPRSMACSAQTDVARSPISRTAQQYPAGRRKHARRAWIAQWGVLGGGQPTGHARRHQRTFYRALRDIPTLESSFDVQHL